MSTTTLTPSVTDDAVSAPTAVPISPAKIAISDTGTPPNGLGGGSPYFPSVLFARCCWRSVRTLRSATTSRRWDGTARGAAPGLRRLRDRRLDFEAATVPGG